MSRYPKLALDRALVWLAVGVAFGSAMGCGTSPQRVSITASAPPPVSMNAALPVLADSDPRIPWTLSESSRLTEPQMVKFAKAREAYWNREPDVAVTLLRELRKDDVIVPEHFYSLVFACYEQSHRWADLLPVFSEFGLEESEASRIAFTRFMAGLPARQIEFAASPTPVPFTLNSGDLVVANVTINGVSGRMLFDTGCGLTWLTEKFARRAGVQVLDQTIMLHDANDHERATAMALIRELQVGGVTVRNMPAMAGRSLLLQLGEGVDGVLGWDLLQYADVTWNFPAKFMVLAEPRGGRSEEPTLSGRTIPILTMVSAAGRPLHVSLDTGAHSGRSTIDVYANQGVLATKTPLSAFHTAWRPTFGFGMHSFSIAWPRLAKPFEFWLSGYRFTAPMALLYDQELKAEDWTYLDGVVGNAPFIGGILHLCGVRREASFVLTDAASK